MKFPLNGRIENAKAINGNIQTILATPAPDAYSQPHTFLLKSKMQLGQIGHEIRVMVELRGFVKKKTFLNKTTNMQDEFWEANVYFDAELAPAVSAKAG